MQTQVGKTSTESQATEADQNLKESFDQIKNTETTRVVTLSYKSCCGCGCDYIDVKRTVPFDSELQDGDTIDSLEDGDDW